jgi:hypothetical protein
MSSLKEGATGAIQEESPGERNHKEEKQDQLQMSQAQPMQKKK